MNNFENLLQFAEELIYNNTGNYLSDLQRIILVNTLQDGRITYEEIADQCGYSSKYVKQDVAPKLWLMLSAILQEKVTKPNLKAVLERRIRQQQTPTELTHTENISVNASVSWKDSEKSNILLVDDQPENLKLLSDLLEEQGYEVQQAINGIVALKAIRLILPDLILLDINMPELDGYAVCQKLKANPETCDIPVIFISAMDEAWDKVKAFSVGGSDYISKPFKVIEVLARVENQLKIQHLQKQLKQKNEQLKEALAKLERISPVSDKE
jgi:PleD family two-component response regulator